MFKRSLATHPTYGSDAQLRKLAGSLLDVYEGLGQAFSADDHRHYKLTPRHLTEWVQGIERYDTQAVDLLDVLAYEGARVFQDRLVGSQAAERFDSLLSSTLRAQWRHTPAQGQLFTSWLHVDDSTSAGTVFSLPFPPQRDGLGIEGSEGHDVNRCVGCEAEEWCGRPRQTVRRRWRRWSSTICTRW